MMADLRWATKKATHAGATDALALLRCIHPKDVLATSARRVGLAPRRADIALNSTGMRRTILWS
jgi:hypothetical protein